jgi:hypothetical protein
LSQPAARLIAKCKVQHARQSQSESRVLERQDQVDPVGTRPVAPGPGSPCRTIRSSCTWQISAAPARRPRRSASTASGSRAVPVAAVRAGSIGSLAAATFQASSPDTFKRVVTFLPMLRHLSMFKARQRSIVVGRGHIFYLRLAKAVAPPVAMLDRASQNCDRWLRQ